MADPSDGMRCEPIYDADGQVIGMARVSPNINDEARRALADVIEAARRAFAELPPRSAEEQAHIDATRARNRERMRRLRGGDR